MKKCWCQQISRGVSRNVYILLDLVQVRYNCAKFHQWRICLGDFRERGPFCPPHPWAVPEKPILRRVTMTLINSKLDGVCKKTITICMILRYVNLHKVISDQVNFLRFMKMVVHLKDVWPHPKLMLYIDRNFYTNKKSIGKLVKQGQ